MKHEDRDAELEKARESLKDKYKDLKLTSDLLDITDDEKYERGGTTIINVYKRMEKDVPFKFNK